MSYKTIEATPSYTNAPPAYDEEAHRPLMGESSHGVFRTDDTDRYKPETVSQSSVLVRLEFVRKVYSILAVQLFATIVIAATMMYNDSIKLWVQTNLWALYVSIFSTFGFLIALNYYARRTPTNFYLLGGFTLGEAYLIGTVTTLYNTEVVLQALILTFGIFVGLTLFTLQSKWDFSGMGPFLFSALIVLLLTSFIQIFFPFSSALNFAISLVAVVVFSCYIVFDTYLIFNRLSPEDYIMGAVSLYLDLLNLFLHLLQILSALQRD